MRATAGPLWAITSLFNPMGYQRRHANYRRFRDALSIPLATVELGFNGHWDLDASAADIYLRVGGGSVLWQKERLLNLLLDRLPPDCQYVAWIDSDLLFMEEDWAARVIEALDSAPLVQPFSKLRYLGPNQSTAEQKPLLDSLAMRVDAGQAVVDAVGRVTDRTTAAPLPGMAWAARREVLIRHGFYDACIIGGGDTALACAAYGVPERVVALHGMNQWQEQRYLAWAEPFYRDISGRVGVVHGEVHHLWHGDLADRHAGTRHAGLVAHDFNPEVDIRIGPEGAWMWASDKPELQTYVSNYFRSRNEDGPVGLLA